MNDGPIDEKRDETEDRKCYINLPVQVTHKKRHIWCCELVYSFSFEGHLYVHERGDDCSDKLQVVRNLEHDLEFDRPKKI